MEKFFLAEWFDSICSIALVLVFLASIVFKTIRDNTIITVALPILSLVLCGYFLPFYSSKIQIKHLRYYTDSDSIQYSAATVITFTYWWIFFIVLFITNTITRYVFWRLSSKPRNQNS